MKLFISVFVFLSLLLTGACSSGDKSDENTDSASVEGPLTDQAPSSEPTLQPDPDNQHDSENPVISTEIPDFFNHRIVSISVDSNSPDINGQVTRYEYDNEGRIISEMDEYGDGLTGFTSNYLYSNDDLIEIISLSGTGTGIGSGTGPGTPTGTGMRFQYENGLLTSSSSYGADSLDETFYSYDNEGRVIGAIGDNGWYDKSTCGNPHPDAMSVEAISINYIGNAISEIVSNDGLYTANFSYNSTGNLTEVLESYTCYESTGSINYSITFDFFYDGAGRVLSIQKMTSNGYMNEELFTYNQAGHIKSSVITEGIEGDYFRSRITDNWSYNELGHPISVHSKEEGDSIFGAINSESTFTVEYENKKCKVAISAEPIVLATLETISPAYVTNDPRLCTFPLQFLGSNKRF